MDKHYKTSLFIFRRDLRLPDNTGLLEACRSSEKVIPAFIFDPRQVDKNPYKSSNAIQFMVESLSELDQSLRAKSGKLLCFEGKAEEVLERLFKNENIEAVFINKDHTPFSLKRDSALEKLCNKNNVSFESFDDALLLPVGSVLKKDGKPYSIFTPFYKEASKHQIESPKKFSFKDCFITRVKDSLSLSSLNLIDGSNDDIAIRGGRKAALKLLKRASGLSNYEEERDIPGANGTTLLSAHHKFGTVSIREVYLKLTEALGKSHTIIRELFWRDFFSNISFHFPRVFEGCFYEQYNKINWENDRTKFKAWCNGKTGFPIVDAGMRELNTTGFMHNRVRMVVASFLTKDLHIDWRWGEKYFAQKLVDYDPAVNNGNWQWAASTGCDAQPYFRIFNPWRQQERFDPDCSYIKKWIPELKDHTSKEIHALSKSPDENFYTRQIVDHRHAASAAEDLFIEARES